MYIKSVELPESEPVQEVKLEKDSDVYNGLVRSITQDLERAKAILANFEEGNFKNKLKLADRGFLYAKTCFPEDEALAVRYLYKAYRMSGLARPPKKDRSYETELGFQSLEEGIRKK